ncbi:AAA family ATPase [Kineococcus rhizosphaerae]|uniref:Dynein-related subfamily AAA family protein n=1 Tax=Kineococcus rhizosphaerae TaxID=559628 RepID=A0A2T0QQ48_9ACTN|nr:AAA family ATPase [Kineococcus rhizosphaerae]PRY06857.1 dynein-related subfamily AAA family protein [Kineococcus rhizosphaerae]
MTADVTLLRVITAAMRSHVTPLLMGDPGVGKSSLAQTLAAADGGRCEVVLGSLREASDFNGLPVVGPDGVTLEAPAWAKRLASGESTHLLLDEVTTVPAHVRKAMLGVILDRTVGDLHLPDSVRILAAANPASIAVDGAAPINRESRRPCHSQLQSGRPLYVFPSQSRLVHRRQTCSLGLQLPSGFARAPVRAPASTASGSAALIGDSYVTRSGRPMWS